MVLGLIAAYLIGSAIGKSKSTTVVVELEEPTPPADPSTQDWSNFYQDTRSFEELLANARARIKREKNDKDDN
jgi:hypothetical protein